MESRSIDLGRGPSPSPGSGSDTLRHLDWFTVALYLLLVAAGVVSVYAASYDYDNASIFSFDEFSGKQIRWIGLSLLLGMVLLVVDARVYETYAYPVYAAMVAVLAVTPLVAPDIKGSHSWITFGPMSLQPAEFAKFATALALAKLFAGYNFALNASWRNYARALTIILLPVVLILLQNETGSALVYLSLFFVLYREGMSGLVLAAALAAVVIFVVALKYTESMVIGIPSGQFAILAMVEALMVAMLALYARRTLAARNLLLWFLATGALEAVLWALGRVPTGYWFFAAALGGAVAYTLLEMLRGPGMHRLLLTAATALAAVAFMASVNMVMDHLQPHQQKRIKVALAIENDPRDAGYNVNQSKIAIGSGGATGKGFLHGTQTKLKYVPEQHTDFIFCTIGEEEGFAGTAAVVALFMALILRILFLAERQPTTFGRVYAYCVASYLTFHFCINIGMVIGLCPVIGIPLPLLSYGGSSLWGFTLLLFILLRVDASRRGRLTQ